MAATAGFQGRDLLSLRDFTQAEVAALLARAASCAAGERGGGTCPVAGTARPLAGRAVGLLFLKPSTRTRVAFEVAAARLGAHPVVLYGGEVQLSRGETAADTARVLSCYVDAVVVRGRAHDEVVAMADAADVPVVNGLTDLLHPTQVLADLLTLQQHFGRLRGLRLAYVGDGNNIANSLAVGAARTGVDLSLACPPGYRPDPEVLAWAAAEARSAGSAIALVEDPRQAAEGADAVYTDVWVSMGQEAGAAARRRDLAAYRVSADLFRRAAPGAVFLHCLPAHRGEEVDASVIDGDHSLVLAQAANRLPVALSVLSAVLGA